MSYLFVFSIVRFETHATHPDRLYRRPFIITADWEQLWRLFGTGFTTLWFHFHTFQIWLQKTFELPFDDENVG